MLDHAKQLADIQLSVFGPRPHAHRGFVLDQVVRHIGPALDHGGDFGKDPVHDPPGQQAGQISKGGS